MVINMIFPQQGKIVAGVGTPPTVGENLSDAENQGDNGSHECMSSGGTNPGPVPRYRSKRGRRV